MRFKRFRSLVVHMALLGVFALALHHPEVVLGAGIVLWIVYDFVL